MSVVPMVMVIISACVLVGLVIYSSKGIGGNTAKS